MLFFKRKSLTPTEQLAKKPKKKEAIKKAIKLITKRSDLSQLVAIYDAKLKKEGLSISRIRSNFIRLIEEKKQTILAEKRIEFYNRRSFMGAGVKKHSVSLKKNSFFNTEINSTFLKIFEEYLNKQLEHNHTEELSKLTPTEIKQNLSEILRRTYNEISDICFTNIKFTQLYPDNTHYGASREYRTENRIYLPKKELTAEEIESLFRR